MSCVDEMMPDYYRLCLESDEPPPADPYTAKREFARRLVERWHGAEAAAAAEAAFDRQFKQGRAAEDAPGCALPAERSRAHAGVPGGERPGRARGARPGG